MCTDNDGDGKIDEDLAMFHIGKTNNSQWI